MPAAAHPSRTAAPSRRAAAAAVAIAIAAAPAAASAYQKTFSTGAIIIPSNIEYQTDDAVISAYGLVYTTLYLNAARVKAGKRPITIYWIIEAKKQSHHRCLVDDGKLPDYSYFNDNDGCDIAIQNDAGQPVGYLDASGKEQTSSFIAYRVGYDTSTGYVCTSRQTAVAGCQAPSPATFTIGSTTKLVKYSGGLWAVEATDRNDFVDMLATEPLLAQYHKNGSGDSHWVALHTARATFTGEVARAINQKPPVLAMLGAGQTNIMLDYLTAAGIYDKTGKSGLPDVQGVWDSALGDFSPHGNVFDVLDPFAQFLSTSSHPKGYLDIPVDPNNPDLGTFYQVLWIPDWAIGTSQTPQGWSWLGETAQDNFYENVSWFVDQGNGLFAEGTAIESLEGSYQGKTSACGVTEVCGLTVDPTITQPFTCDAGYSSGPVTAQCNACYACPNGYSLDANDCTNVFCAGSCPAGTTAACGQCWDACKSGYVLSASDCNHVVCTSAGITCAQGVTPACGGCYDCPSGYTLDASTCSNIVCYACPAGTTYSTTMKGCAACPSSYTFDDKLLMCKQGKTQVQPTWTYPLAPKIDGSWATTTATSSPAQTTQPTTGTRYCPTGYALECPGGTMSVIVNGSDQTRFQTTKRIVKNGMGNSFQGSDCTDRLTPSGSKFHNAQAASVACLDYHPETGGPGQIFSQKGSFNYSGSTGDLHEYEPAADAQSVYWPNVFRLISTKSSDATQNGWDFGSFRHKDSDPSKGLVVYLSGHSYKSDLWGLRIVLNTLLNLGFSSVGVELARSEPVGYEATVASSTATTQRIYQGTYVQVPQPTFQDWVNFTVGSTQSWRFPYTAGHLYEYDVSNIPTGSASFTCAAGATSGTCPTANWDAGSSAKMPAPKDRTIFTVLDGSAQLGWRKVDFKYTQTRSGCVDQDQDGYCDLSTALAQCATAGVQLSTLKPYNDTDKTQRDQLGMFVQQVRGFCSAHSPKLTGSVIDPPEPSDAQCDDLKQQKNRAKLGGIDHGSPAIVGKSRYVTGSYSGVSWTDRPTVAYVGARDGMLHAIYVSGGSSWKDPSGASLPSGIQPGTELWAFVPPGQICGLATNNAMVDASVNVIDVFGDFPHDANGDGVIDWTDSKERPTHVREWRTVLLAAAGLGGSELFAMDVTSPLNPVLLWHVGGASEKDGRFDLDGDGVFESGEVFDKGILDTYAIKWFDWDDGDKPAVTDFIPTRYDEADPAILDEIKFGKNDYRNLGLTYGTAIGKIWRGNAFQYVAYVLTNAADYTSSTPTGYAGVELFAIDLVSGQKLWQWEKMYKRARTDGGVIADDTIPGRPALADVDSDGSVDRIYVGDLEGRIWELSALDGRNVNYLPVKGGSTSSVSFPLFGTVDMTGTGASAETLATYKVAGGSKLAEQPLTSPIGMGRFTQVKPELANYLPGRLAILQGTMGVDWSIAPFEKGSVYVIPVSPEFGTRVQTPVDVGVTPDPRIYGVLVPDAAWRIELQTGERVFGMPRVINNEVIFNTAFGSFSGDITSSVWESGSFYQVTKDATTATSNTSKSFGGVVVFADNVIITTDNSISKRPADAALKAPEGTSNRPFDRFTPAIFKTWEPLPDCPECPGSGPHCGPCQ